MRKLETRELSIGAMITVLSVITLYLSSVLVTTKLSLLVAGSILISIAVVETGKRGGTIVYISSSVLGMILVPNKLFVLGYIVFFGLYPLLKYVIEGIDRATVEWPLKFVAFNILSAAGYGVFTVFFAEGISIPIPMWTMWLAVQPAFIVYDYVLSIVITQYVERIKPKIDIKK